MSSLSLRPFPGEEGEGPAGPRVHGVPRHGGGRLRDVHAAGRTRAQVRNLRFELLLHRLL